VKTVYNLHVEDYHTYFVGAQAWGFAVWVHNAGDTGDCSTPGGQQPTQGDPAQQGGQQPPGGITQSGHARLRGTQGRPIPSVVNDVQRAGRRDVFVQPEDGRFVVRGAKGREHIIEPNGEHVTSVNRSDAAHRGRLNAGQIRPATDEEFDALKEFVQ
jgi:hypothetical protein